MATPRPVLELRLGDRIELARPHPCGERRWSVVRLGADIGLVCDGCGRRIMLARGDLERRFRGYVERGPEPGPAA
jgi:hypothetical protein